MVLGRVVGTTDVEGLVETVVVSAVADEVLPGCVVVDGAVAVVCDASCVAIEVSVVRVVCVDTDGMLGAIVENGVVAWWLDTADVDAAVEMVVLGDVQSGGVSVAHPPSVNASAMPRQNKRFMEKTASFR